MSEIETPKCGQAFVGDPSVGLPPELETWQDAHDFCVRLEKQLTAVTAERDRYRKALEDAANSLFTIANSAGKDELMSDMLSVRGYANSRGTVAQQALAGKDEPRHRSTCGQCGHPFSERACGPTHAMIADEDAAEQERLRTGHA